MEMMYQYLWKNRMLGRCDFRLTDGRCLRVIHPGEHNRDAGPDFFNARIRVDDEDWAGNVEIHVKASDWYRHGHQRDHAYDTVILHVVAEDDGRVTRPDGSTIPQLVIRLPEGFVELYKSMSLPQADIKCRSYLPELPSLVISDWLESLAVQRLQQKATRIDRTLTLTGGDWEQVCFVILARSLGFSLNNDAFEMLARSVPLRILYHHSDSVFQLEAILFGQAGMLDSVLHPEDAYYQRLCREYAFLARKYDLMRPGCHWKGSKTRPQNMPHRRIAMLASVVEGGFSMFRKIIDSEGDIDKLYRLFDLHIDGYWQTHFSFQSAAVNAPGSLSRPMRTGLLINVAAPLIYTYAVHRDDPYLEQAATDILAALPAEQNAYMRTWAMLGLRPDSALRSQALLHLRREYCDKGKCLYCRFGKRYIQGSLLDALLG